MAINPLKAFLFLTGGAGAAVGGAYVTGLVDVLNAPVPGIEAKAPEQPKSAALTPQPEPAAPDEPAKPAETGMQAPSFDVLRVEPDGSVVIAGKAAAGSEVDVVVDGVVVAKGKADAGGDFAVVLEKPLAPGDHQIVLIARAEAGEPLQSAETATVSIPDTPGGEVLAMIEEPGKASEIVAMPAAEPAKPAEAKPADAAAAPATPEPAKPALLAVAIKAVEIEGEKIFVAGTGQPGYAARIYVDDLLLGEAPVQPDGGFVVEAVRELSVGAHAVRADLVGLKDGAVVARSQVPFEREPGEQVAAVAPSEPAKPAEVAAADPAPVAEAPKLVPAGNAVIIRKGDTLWRISRRVYGRGVRFTAIYTANSGKIENPNRIWPGQVFAVPGKTETGEAADMSAVSDQVAPAEAPAQSQ